MPIVKTTKADIIRASHILIQRKSFKSVTYDQIAGEINIKKSSIYHHFPSKDELGLEVLKSYHQSILEEINNLDYYTDDPARKLKIYFRFFVNVQRNTPNGFGMCPAGVMMTEFNILTPEIQQELKNFFDDNTQWLAKILEYGRESGIFSFSGSAFDKANFIEGSIQGGLLVSRMHEDRNILYNTMKQLKEDLGYKEPWSITKKDEKGNQVII